MTKTWLITGCSTGFGKQLTEAVLARGDRLVATARNPEALKALVSRYPETLRTTPLDVTREGDAAAAVRLAQDAFGGSTCWSTMPGSGSSPRSRKAHRTNTGPCSKPMFSA